MDLLSISLIFSALFCTLVTGFILSYAIIVMPGLSKLNDREFIRAFQVTDGIIQNNQPLFILIWIGSILSIVSTVISSILIVGFFKSWFLILVAAFYLLGVQGITISIHLPLNNHIQNLNIDKLSDEILREERLKFEDRWNWYNKVRTGISFSVSLILIVIVTM